MDELENLQASCLLKSLGGWLVCFLFLSVLGPAILILAAKRRCGLAEVRRYLIIVR